ncbi:MAG: peptidoglycan-associated lipoprotein Pal [Pseudomonadota bacterium]|nr:peptidoglycan-associated lipoprotein Pal [Pseudomonadota bacterium]
MRMKIFPLVAAILMLSACEATVPKDSGSVTDGGGVSAAGGSQVSGAMPYDVEDLTVQEELEIKVGDRVFFDLDKYNLKSAARATLERQAVFLKKNKSMRVLIEGHCDERGTREYNLALGARRAAAARNYLVALGVAPERVTTISYGKERPVVLGSNEAAWAQNRRGVTVIR